MKSLTPSSIRQMERAIEQHMYFIDIPGLAVCLLADKELVYVNGFGMADLSANKRMTSGAIFHMASISKLFTATAVMQLHEQGKLDIDAPVQDYLKGFIPFSSAFGSITIRQMLSHTAGIPDCEDYEWEFPRYDDQALHDYVMSQTEMRLLSEPGKRFFYSNIAYEMLGELIQGLSGLTFEDYCKKYLFIPMGMLQSDFLKERVSSGRLVQPHIKDRANQVKVSDVFPYHRAHGPSSTLYSTVEELSLFAAAMMDTLEGKRKDIIAPATLKTMLTYQAVIKSGERIGLGWFISDYADQLFYGHEGNDIGFRTTFAMIPQKRTAIIVLANLQTASTRKIMRTIYDMTVGSD